MAHVAAWKKEVVKEIVDNIKKYKVIGIFDVNNLPSLQLQRMRATLRDKGTFIKIVKKNLLKIALDEVKNNKPGIEKLEAYLEGQVGILFTNENPFSLYKLIKKSKTTTAAKPGQVAPKDIWIKAGPTPFAPGPIIGELGQVGVKAGVDKGKVVIKQDALVAKKGDVINAKLAEILKRLGIEPIEVGLNIHAVYEDGIIYEASVLDINEEEYIENITRIASEAFALSLGLGYICRENAETLLINAIRNARALARETDYISNDTIEMLLSKAVMHANALPVNS